ncbi:MAG: HAD family phosphatase [Bacteroidales bacterium]|jgi:beta-phosphoglucomutase|nr:HAD family phosphatase [Bacteroidales bacterium]
MINTIFFDLDGVIIDSEPIHAKAKKLTLDEYGIGYPASIFDDFIGLTDEDFFKYVSVELEKKNRPFEILLQKKQELFIELLPEMKFVDDFLLFYQEIKNKGMKTALVSSVSTYTFELVDKNFNISHLFDLLVTKKDTVHHKPHPAPYIKALQKLPASIESTIVIEDSPNGITSAKKAGCKVFALTTSFGAEKLTEADEIFGSYMELSGKLGLTYD